MQDDQRENGSDPLGPNVAQPEADSNRATSEAHGLVTRWQAPWEADQPTALAARRMMVPHGS